MILVCPARREAGRPAIDIEQIRAMCQEGMERLRYMD